MSTWKFILELHGWNGERNISLVEGRESAGHTEQMSSIGFSSTSSGSLQGMQNLRPHLYRATSTGIDPQVICMHVKM